MGCAAGRIPLVEPGCGRGELFVTCLLALGYSQRSWPGRAWGGRGHLRCPVVRRSGARSSRDSVDDLYFVDHLCLVNHLCLVSCLYLVYDELRAHHHGQVGYHDDHGPLRQLYYRDLYSPRVHHPRVQRSGVYRSEVGRPRDQRDGHHDDHGTDDDHGTLGL